MKAPAVAQLLGNTLYYRRFFPYYAFCLIAGIDDNGRGCVYGYDAVGSFKRDDYGCMGSAQNFLWPLLDNLVICNVVSVFNFLYYVSFSDWP
jgi:20S proteasome subunit beta 6